MYPSRSISPFGRWLVTRTGLSTYWSLSFPIKHCLSQPAGRTGKESFVSTPIAASSMFSFSSPAAPAFPKLRFGPPLTLYAFSRRLGPNWQEPVLQLRWGERYCDRMAWAKGMFLLKIYGKGHFWFLPQWVSFPFCPEMWAGDSLQQWSTCQNIDDAAQHWTLEIGSHVPINTILLMPNLALDGVDSLHTPD